ncbi:unnamed protein product [Schistosoma margrebowiei]|uniref:Uncharacterized protein n=1 Tax=Schistosoma margrebowiei TaxID=48269 RepID=A0A3P8CK58_9TREM|nr:unnamed protein product [Schistosoma margrebowiei]
MTWLSDLPIVMNQPSYTGWNNRSSRSYHARHVGWRAVRLKATNLRSEGKVVLLTVQRCDSSKVFPSDNQHDSDAAFPQGGVRLKKVDPHLIPWISISSGKFSTSTELTRNLRIKRSCNQPQTVFLWALRSHSQVTKTTSNPMSFSGTYRRTLQRCGQPGSDNRPHTSNNTQDH